LVTITGGEEKKIEPQIVLALKLECGGSCPARNVRNSTKKRFRGKKGKSNKKG